MRGSCFHYCEAQVSGAVVVGETGSAETFDDPALCDPAFLAPRGGCCTDALFADATSPAATVAVGSFGLVPPFHVEGP